jgi:hypothetical protein
LPRKRPAERLQQVLAELGLEEMAPRFYTESAASTVTTTD